MRLNYYDNSWPLTLSNSPCDLHFIEWLRETQLTGKLIFHFGTGEHHLVGKDNHERGNPNEIVAITASKKEHNAYIDFIVDNPAAANHYKVFFGDIYTLSAAILPAFDVITLFHLCEYYDEDRYDKKPSGSREQTDAAEPFKGDRRLNSEYARLNDVKLLELSLAKLTAGGKILFFTESGAYDRNGGRTAAIINDFIYRKRMIVEGQHQTLLICGRPW